MTKEIGGVGWVGPGDGGRGAWHLNKYPEDSAPLIDGNARTLRARSRRRWRCTEFLREFIRHPLAHFTHPRAPPSKHATPENIPLARRGAVRGSLDVQAHQGYIY